MDEMEGVICRTITIKTRNIKRIVVNMPWKENRDFFKRMARYVLRILYNTEKGEETGELKTIRDRRKNQI